MTRFSLRPSLVSLVLLLLLAVSALPTQAQAQDDPAYAWAARGYEALRVNDGARAIDAFRRSLAADPSNQDIRLQLAYTLLSANRQGESAQQFARYLSRTDDRADVWAQLGYVLLTLERTDDAIFAFNEAVNLDYEDRRVALQLGYLLVEQNRLREARRAFRTATRTTDVETRTQATRLLQMLDTQPRRTAATRPYFGPSGWSGDVYAAPMFLSRYDNLVSSLLVRFGPTLGTPRLQAYGIVRVTRDTRSTGGSLPIIFSDNVLIGGIGVKARVHPWALTLYSEAGMAAPLVTGQDIEPDFRAGGYGAKRWPAQPRAMAPIVNLYYDVSYYSRLDNNLIGYGQLRPGFRLVHSDNVSLDAYAAALGAFDTDGLFFNNVADMGGGLRLMLFGSVQLMGEWVQGTYLGDTPLGTSYEDLRVALIFSQNF
ncbi:MAG: tetratricopeptide repeat protein [Bacteroidota bacterium]